jgi:hypothetical protein
MVVYLINDTQYLCGIVFTIVGISIYIIANVHNVNNPLVPNQSQAYLNIQPLAPYLVQADFKRDTLAHVFPHLHFRHTFDPGLPPNSLHLLVLTP